jgi:CheY-like chemotaxis protein/nitrogen-specific signal transduction histidine kinase
VYAFRIGDAAARKVAVLFTDITARKRAEAEREALVARLREADRRKDEFLAMLAHELRNPLAPIRNSLHILRLTAGGAGGDGVLDMIERQVTHMVRLVDDLLEVSRITRGKIDLRRGRVELAAVVRTAVETSRPFLDAAGHDLTVDLPPEPLVVDGDPVRLAQVLANLLNNAAKYTDPGGKVRVAARRDGAEAVLAVRDTGAGIPPDMLARVFDLFTQVDRSDARAQGGLGIGLTLVKSLTELHGGRVAVRSDGPGTGSEFEVRLPLRGDEGEGVREELTSGGTTAPGPGSSLVPRPSSLRRVLVVDDNRDAADSLGALLGLIGVEARVVYSGPDALAAVGEFHPAVVLLDLGMPGMDGYEVARRVRARADAGRVTLVALTGWGQDEDRRRSRAAGFDHHLTKPADVDALEALLRSLGGV